MAETVSVNVRNTNSTMWAWLAGLVGWAVPGIGHLMQGRVHRGLLLGGAVWVMFISGILLGGQLYGILSSGAGVLSYVFGFLNLGTGLLYVLCQTLGIATENLSMLATSEYGNIFLMVAGLLNYLLALDAFDIGAGRKL